MAGAKGPDETGEARPGKSAQPKPQQDDLVRRSRELEAALAAKRAARDENREGATRAGMAGLGPALRLSSEFIAAVALGAALGWFIDYLAGTSPWGLMIFLLLGFAAGVLSVLRSAGLVAERKLEPRDGSNK